MQQQPQDATHGEREGRISQALYSRPMPGGGCVRVELLVGDRGNVSGELLRGRVIMHRRAADAEHLVVEEVEGPDANSVVAELFRIARDNAAIARRVLRRQARSGRAD